MGNTGIETKSTHCRQCSWCAKYTNFDPIQNTRTPVYLCQFPGSTFKKGRLDTPSLDKHCPYFALTHQEKPED